MFKKLTGAFVGLTLMGMAGAANAAVLDIDPSTGKLLGAFDVNVSGTLYNVRFVDGACVGLFGICDTPDFDFTTESDALLAAAALLNQVFLDGPLGAFDTAPGLTTGCSTSSSECRMFVPFGISPAGGIGDLLVIHTANFAIEPDIILSGFFNPSFDTSTLSSTAYAVFSVVPVPPAIWLMVSALLSFAVPFWRRKRLGDVEV